MFDHAHGDGLMAGVRLLQAHALAPGQDLHTSLALLSAAAVGRPVTLPVPLAAVLAALQAARYAVILWEPAHASADGVQAVNQTHTWLTGLPLRTRIPALAACCAQPGTVYLLVAMPGVGRAGHDWRVDGIDALADIWLRGGRVVVAGGIDMHTHIGGGKVNLARLMLLEDHRAAAPNRTLLELASNGCCTPPRPRA